MYNLIMTTNEPEISLIALNRAIEWREWTSTRLSKESGVSAGMISLLLQGERPNASAVVVAKLARSLGVSIDFLMGETGNPVPGGTIEVGLTEILKVAQKLSPTRQRELLAIAEALLKIEKAADVDSIYSEMMDLITRLAEMDGGRRAFNDLMSHIATLTGDDSFDDDCDDCQDDEGAVGSSPSG